MPTPPRLLLSLHDATRPIGTGGGMNENVGTKHLEHGLSYTQLDSVHYQPHIACRQSVKPTTHHASNRNKELLEHRDECHSLLTSTSPLNIGGTPAPMPTKALFPELSNFFFHHLLQFFWFTCEPFSCIFINETSHHELPTIQWQATESSSSSSHHDPQPCFPRSSQVCDTVLRHRS